ncbi:MAG: TRAP transporter fused permease subunit [Deltaproteobacteria bacterium]|nr:MAG: TRAP transporter fused permease subunit [Deltaproteobacteria bacterium]
MEETIFPKPISLVSAIKLTAAVIAIVISIFHLYTGAFGILEAYQMRSIHLMTLLTLAFLYWPAAKKWSRKKSAIIDIPLALICLVIDFYLMANHYRITTREWYTGPMTSLDIAFGWITMVLLLEATRRVAGPALPIVALSFVAYTLLGQFLPYPLTIPPSNLRYFIDYMFLTPQAIFGVPVGVSATFVFLFIIFAALLDKTGAGRFIIDFSLSAVGWATGGPAKVAVIASSLFGTISGHSVANVYGTGTFTIPLMKKTGYKPEYAGAVEAAASAGGQIMPPIMGAAAFIMAEIIGISYISVCKAAIVPAILYFTAVFVSTHLEARKTGLTSIPRSELPSMKETLWRGFHYALPILCLIIILVQGFTPFRAAFIAINALLIVVIVRYLFEKFWQMTVGSNNKDSHDGSNAFRTLGSEFTRAVVQELPGALVAGARNAVVIATCCACAGIVVGCLDTTGMGIKFVDVITTLSGGIFPLMLLLVMLGCLILGMGIPTAPAYIIVALIAAPSLKEVGLSPIAAHMFVFYGCLLSAITPPVALAAYAGAAIADAPVMRTGVIAAKLGFVKYIVPFVFAYNAALLMEGNFWFILLSVTTAFIGTVGLSAALERYFFASLSVLELLLFFVGSVLLLISSITTDFFGFAILFVGATMNYMSRKKAVRYVT